MPGWSGGRLRAIHPSIAVLFVASFTRVVELSEDVGRVAHERAGKIPVRVRLWVSNSCPPSESSRPVTRARSGAQPEKHHQCYYREDDHQQAPRASGSCSYESSQRPTPRNPGRATRLEI